MQSTPTSVWAYICHTYTQKTLTYKYGGGHQSLHVFSKWIHVKIVYLSVFSITHWPCRHSILETVAGLDDSRRVTWSPGEKHSPQVSASHHMSFLHCAHFGSVKNHQEFKFSCCRELHTEVEDFTRRDVFQIFSLDAGWLMAHTNLPTGVQTIIVAPNCDKNMACLSNTSGH